MPEIKPHIDVLLVVPLAEELESIFTVFPYESDHSDDTFQLNRVQSPGPALSIYVIKLKEMGNAAARNACNFVLARYTVGLVVAYGIAGGLKKDLKLGDVCVSHQVLDLSDQFKIEDENDALSVAPSPRHLEVDINLCSRFAFLCEHPIYYDLKHSWEEACLEHLLTIETEHPEDYSAFKKQVREQVRVFFGPIVSYGVVASDKFAKALQSLDRNVLAVETESAGVFEVVSNFDTPAITVRGISDFADSKKSQLESESKECVRTIAATNAAHYLFHQFKCPPILSFLEERRKLVRSDATGDLFDTRESEPLDELLRDIEEEIDSQLKEKCPAYRHKPKRSLLPAPRVIRVGGPSDPGRSQDWDDPSEIADIVEQFERLMISLEATYPDRALPWVIADMILRTNGARIFVPIVVDGEQVSPKRFQLAKMPRMKQVASIADSPATAVLILDDPNLQSNTRARALIDEANANPTVKFVVVVKKFNAPVTSRSFSEQFNCERFSVADFSLGALSDYVSSNFGYDLSQAAVLATKLNDTFEQFRMHAHPSYFAGISPESLAALMAANRRGELIHLAVDAALMIMVAEDRADIQVSKRWRRDFLKDIAVRQFVRGEQIDETRAIEIANEMASRRDIDIKALEFVQSFVRAGVFDFRDREVEFVLVYVRDYLVAEYLYENAARAAAYFGFDEIDEDYNVLDMYAELGPADEVVARVAQLVEEDVKYLDQNAADTIDNLISNKVELSEVNSFDKFMERKERLLRAIEYVGENPADLKRKQDLLDLRRSVSQRIGERVGQKTADGDKEVGEDEEDITSSEMGREKEGAEDSIPGDGIPRGRISAHWSAGCAIVGAGAEQIDAGPKRRLVKGLVALGCRVAEQWTAEVASVDFSELRKDILCDSEYKRRREQMDESEWTELMKDFDHLLHLLEFSFVSNAYRTVLAVLCGQEGGNVLRKSVKETKLDRDFEELTRAVWVCDLDAEKADKLFRGSLKRIGKSTILRFVLAEHFISRVYWAKWRANDRKAFLEVATKILDGLDGQLDKGKMKRIIDRTSESA